MGAHDGYRYSKAMAVVPLALIVVLFTTSAGGVTHTVGGSIWSIPPSINFYDNWSSSQTFRQGDFLYFDFESAMYSVQLVTWWDYVSCYALIPTENYEEGPALVPLTDEGIHHFICSLSNHCSQGVKFTLYAAKLSTDSTPPATVP